jgi:hypothetical protein
LTAGLVLGLGGWRQLLDCAVLLRHVFHGGGGILRPGSAFLRAGGEIPLEEQQGMRKGRRVRSGGARVEMSVVFSR